jgi:hypothetical protein
MLFPLGHPPLLRHIRWELVSAAAIASLCEDTALFPPTESLGLAVADRLTFSIFGGFTPVKWESPSSWKLKSDDSLFTVRNPQSVPLRKFALKEEKKEYTFWCNSVSCVAFDYIGFSCDITISDNCNAHSFTRIGTL